MHWPFETASSRAGLQALNIYLHPPSLCPRLTYFGVAKPSQRKENFKSVAESGTKSAALSGYSLVVERKLPKL